MKIRTNFVSNSSSCSFVICKNFINEGQIEKILEWYETLPEYIDDYGRHIEQNKNYVYGHIGHASRIYDILIQLDIPKENVVFIE